MKIALFGLVLVASAVVSGCTGDECDKQQDRINDYIESCDGAVPPPTAGEECSAELQKQLRAAADAFVKESCESVRARYPK